MACVAVDSAYCYCVLLFCVLFCVFLFCVSLFCVYHCSAYCYLRIVVLRTMHCCSSPCIAVRGVRGVRGGRFCVLLLRVVVLCIVLRILVLRIIVLRISLFCVSFCVSLFCAPCIAVRLVGGPRARRVAARTAEPGPQRRPRARVAMSAPSLGVHSQMPFAASWPRLRLPGQSQQTAGPAADERTRQPTLVASSSSASPCGSRSTRSPARVTTPLRSEDQRNAVRP